MVFGLVLLSLLATPPSAAQLTPTPVTPTFDDRPVAEQVREGAAMFLAHRPADEVFRPETVTIGRWFDGRGKKGIEWAIWLSPALVSRRLGYLQAREAWSDDRLQAHWQLARETLGGRISILVRLCAFPKMDWLSEEPQETRPIGAVTPVLVIDGQSTMPLEPIVLEDRHGWTREDVLTPWTSDPRLADFMAAAGEAYVTPNLTGDFESETILLQAPTVPLHSLGIIISSTGKTRRADFDLAERMHRRW
jgi:hypothetical protein